MRVLNDEALAVEVTQEAYHQLWTDSGRFDPTRGSAISWILTAVHHRVVRELRASGARDVVEHVGRELGAMDTLHASEREAVELAYFEGWTHSEVAHLSGVSQATVLSRIRDGLLTQRGR